MSETIPGGIYKDAVGPGYHDSEGKPVDASKVAEANKVEQPPQPELAPPMPPQPQAGTVTDTAALTAETERRARSKSS